MLDTRTVTVVGLAFGLTAAALAASVTTVDLGQAPAGTVDDFQVEVRNQSCDEPQNFRFAPRGLPWLKLVNGGSVRNVARGTSRMFVARIDLTGMRAGRYAGQLDVICETCGDFVMSRCHIDRETISIQVEVGR